MTESESEPGASYLNVDLEIRSSSDLKPLADALSKRLFVLPVRRVRREFFLSLEVPGVSVPPDTAIKKLAKAMSALPAPARKVWKQAHDRVFNVGIEKTNRGGAFALALRPETVATAARLNARLAFTLYPAMASRRRLPNRPLQRP